MTDMRHKLDPPGVFVHYSGRNPPSAVDDGFYGHAYDRAVGVAYGRLWSHIDIFYSLWRPMWLKVIESSKGARDESGHAG